jgi:hypothetical protein
MLMRVAAVVYCCSGFFGRDSTIEEVMEREAVRVVKDGLLSLRADGHMFHQVSLGVWDWVTG